MVLGTARGCLPALAPEERRGAHEGHCPHGPVDVWRADGLAGRGTMVLSEVGGVVNATQWRAMPRWRDEPGLENEAMAAVRLSSLWMGWAGKAGCWSGIVT